MRLLTSIYYLVPLIPLAFFSPEQWQPSDIRSALQMYTFFLLPILLWAFCCFLIVPNHVIHHGGYLGITSALIRLSVQYYCCATEHSSLAGVGLVYLIMAPIGCSIGAAAGVVFGPRPWVKGW